MWVLMGRTLQRFLKASLSIFLLFHLFFPWTPAYVMPICDVSKIIINSKNKPLIYYVEVADTHDSRRKGLMFRKNMAIDHGMLFIFERAKYVNMWMKNTELKLDIIFASDDGIITQIVRNASPMSEKIYSSNSRVKYVLEFPSDGKDVASIEIGNSISHCSLN